MNLIVAKTFWHAKKARRLLNLDETIWRAEGPDGPLAGNRFNQILLIKWRGFTLAEECWKDMYEHIRCRLSVDRNIMMTKYFYDITDRFEKL
jgi:hypothetical protein